MTAPPDRVARFDLVDGEMVLSTQSGDWVYRLDHQAAIAAARAEGREQGLREAVSVCDAIDNQCGMEAGLAASCRDAILALIPDTPADGGDNG